MHSFDIESAIQRCNIPPTYLQPSDKNEGDDNCNEDGGSDDVNEYGLIILKLIVQISSWLDSRDKLDLDHTAETDDHFQKLVWLW